MRNFARSMAAIALAVSAISAQAGVAVIAHPAAAKSPSQTEVANIFLGKDKSLTGIDQEGWNPVKENFYTTVTSKNESQLKSYWSGLIFTGKGQPPASVAGDAAVVAKVAADPNAIGYVDSAAVTDAVKVLFTLP